MEDRAKNRTSTQEREPIRLTPGGQGALVVLGTLLITGLIVGVLLLQVWNRVQVFELGYQMTALTRERQQLFEERERLRIEMVVSSTTERLDKVAREDLGLTPIAPHQVILIEDRRTASAEVAQ
jgi:cell division protein FtsL